MLQRNNSSCIWRFLVLAVAMVGIGRTDAQELEFSATPSPVGAGARAAGMADAFIAVADDATAASWNPAGLVQLEQPEIAVVGDWLRVRDALDWTGRGGAEDRFASDGTRLNFFSLTYPFPRLLLGQRVVGSLSYQRRLDFDRELGLNLRRGDVSPAGVLRTRDLLRFRQEGTLATVSVALAMELTPTLSVGAAVNFWRDTPFSENGWRQELVTETSTQFGLARVKEQRLQRTRYEEVSGENVTLGLLWEPTSHWRLGLRYESRLRADARYRATTVRRQTLFGGGALASLYTPIPMAVGREERTVALPASWGLGVAWHGTPRLTLALDITRKSWEDFYIEARNGRRFSLVDGSDLSHGLTRPHIDPTWTVRAGAEYVFLPRAPEDELRHLWSLRGGLFYDEEPATGRPSAHRLLERGDGDSDPFWGIALGVGYQASRWLNMDLGYQLRYGQGVNRDFVRNVRGFEEDALQHRIVFSTVVYF